MQITVDWYMIDILVFYAVSVVFQLYNSGMEYDWYLSVFYCFCSISAI